MIDHAEELRHQAARCLILARKAINPEVRAGLITMAQALYELAKSEPARLDRLDRALSALNERQLI
jgi:hypothetical protein